MRRLVHSSCAAAAQVPLGQPVPVRAERFLHELKKKRQPQEVSPVGPGADVAGVSPVPVQM